MLQFGSPPIFQIIESFKKHKNNPKKGNKQTFSNLWLNIEVVCESIDVMQNSTPTESVLLKERKLHCEVDKLLYKEQFVWHEKEKEK